jgi:hypothetical protein
MAKATRSGRKEAEMNPVTGTVYAAIADSITHVLVWIPPWQAKNGRGDWELMRRSEFSGGNIQGDWDTPHLPEDAPVPDLAEWVRGQLGYPVALYLDTEAIFVPRCLRGRLHNPLYYITPV